MDRKRAAHGHSVDLGGRLVMKKKAEHPASTWVAFPYPGCRISPPTDGREEIERYVIEDDDEIDSSSHDR